MNNQTKAWVVFDEKGKPIAIDSIQERAIAKFEPDYDRWDGYWCELDFTCQQVLITKLPEGEQRERERLRPILLEVKDFLENFYAIDDNLDPELEAPHDQSLLRQIEELLSQPEKEGSKMENEPTAEYLTGYKDGLFDSDRSIGKKLQADRARFREFLEGARYRLANCTDREELVLWLDGQFHKILAEMEGEG